jgi:hypothetical protein
MITWGEVAQLPNAFGEDASTLMEEQAATAAAWACSTPEVILIKLLFRRRTRRGDISSEMNHVTLLDAHQQNFPQVLSLRKALASVP